MFKPRRRDGSRAPAVEVTKPGSFNSELVSMFLSLQEKLNGPVFNGGFDKLIMKVDSIETSQKQTSELISTINKTIYEPDDGLYSRIKNVEKLNSDKLTVLASAQEQLKEDLSEMKTTLRESVKLSSDVQSLAREIEDLKEWKSSFNKKLWILIPTFFATFLKFGWDMIASHISLK